VEPWAGVLIASHDPGHPSSRIFEPSGVPMLVVVIHVGLEQDRSRAASKGKKEGVKMQTTHHKNQQSHIVIDYNYYANGFHECLAP
jgi:hypothetical protein